MFVRSLFAVALAALLAGPGTAHAQAKKSTTKAAAAPAASTTSTGAKQFSLGGWIGYEMGDLDGLQLRGEYVMPYQKLSPQVDLSFVGSVGYSYLTFSESLGTLGDAESTANVLKFVPAARFSLPVNPQLSVFGDAGLGLYWASMKVKTPIGFGQTVSASDSGAGFMLRFGVGGLYKINPQMNIGASLVLDPMFGDYEDTTFSILAGLTYALK
jgi:opacity protein-like surface antigen